MASELQVSGRHAAPRWLKFSALAVATLHAEAQRVSIARVAFLLTVLYAGVLFWLAPYPPMADLPQHAGQIVLLRELLFGQTQWEPLLRINYFTPYWTAYGLTLPLTFLMPVVDAMKLVLTISFYGFVLCCVLLRRHFRSDDRLDWLFIPGFFGFAYGWGFFPFLIAAPLCLLFLLMADRYAQRPALAAGIRLSGMGVVLFFSHGLVFLFACATGIALLLVRTSSWRRTLAALLPYVPLGALSIVYAIVSHSREATLPDGTNVTVWWLFEPRLNFISNIFSPTPYDLQGATFIAVAGVAMLWAPRLLRSSINKTQPAVFVPLAALLLVWLAAPNYAMKINFIYQRFALFILPFFALVFCRAPVLSRNADQRLRIQAGACQVLLASLCWFFLAGHTERLLRYAEESREFDIVRAAVVPGQRALSMVLESRSNAAKNHVAYHHHPLWYQAENGGFVDFNAAWATSVMVRFRREHLPKVGPMWTAKNFKLTRDTAQLYRYFFVRHTEPLPSILFRNDQCEVSLLKSAGSWSVYESSGCNVEQLQDLKQAA